MPRGSLFQDVTCVEVLDPPKTERSSLGKERRGVVGARCEDLAPWKYDLASFNVGKAKRRCMKSQEKSRGFGALEEFYGPEHACTEAMTAAWHLMVTWISSTMKKSNGSST